MAGLSTAFGSPCLESLGCKSYQRIACCSFFTPTLSFEQPVWLAIANQKEATPAAGTYATSMPKDFTAVWPWLKCLAATRRSAVKIAPNSNLAFFSALNFRTSVGLDSPVAS